MQDKEAVVWNHSFKCKLFVFLFGFGDSSDRNFCGECRGQQLAQQMQATNPELVEQLRRQMGGGAGGGGPFDPAADSESKDPQ